jgi:hypothetical protein
MELEVEGLTGAAYGEKSQVPDPAQWLSRAELGDPRWHSRASHSLAAQGLLLAGLSRTAADGREKRSRQWRRRLMSIGSVHARSVLIPDHRWSSCRQSERRYDLPSRSDTSLEEVVATYDSAEDRLRIIG